MFFFYMLVSSLDCQLTGWKPSQYWWVPIKFLELIDKIFLI